MSRVDGLKVALDMETSLHGRLTVMDGQQRRVDVDDKTILLACTLGILIGCARERILYQ